MNWLRDLDRFDISVISLLVGLLALCIMGMVAYRQSRQLNIQKQLIVALSHNIFGSLSGFEAVESAIIHELRRVQDSDDSKVWFMAYWLWFGCDQALHDQPSTEAIDEIEQTDSLVWRLFSQRRAKQNKELYQTSIYIYDTSKAGGSLKEFAKAVLKYKKPNMRLNEDALERLLERYAKSLQTLIDQGDVSWQYITTGEVIPAILLAIEDGDYRVGIIYLGETSALIQGAPTGGFRSRDPELVSIIREQIEHSVKSAGGSV